LRRGRGGTLTKCPGESRKPKSSQSCSFTADVQAQISKLLLKTNLSVQFQRLPEGAVVLTMVFKENNSLASAASVSECLTLLLALDNGHLKLP